MRILVTGHNGYIGTVLTPLLLEQGHEVIGLDTDFYAGCDFGDGIPEVRSIRKDVRDVELVDIEGVDVVIHLAALSNDPLGNLNPELTYDINHAASIRLAKMAKEVGAERFIFSSSCSTYGAAGEDMLTEKATFNPVTPYGITKVMVEQDLAKLADDNFSPVYLRNATAYGISPRLRFGLVLNDLVALALTTGLIYLKSDGTPWRPLIHVEDICRAFLATLNAPREVSHNQAFNVGITEENYQIRELAAVVREIVPDCRIEYAPDAGPDKRSYRVDFTKIAQLLPDFQPQWNVRKGTQDVYETFKAVGLSKTDFRGPRYKRIDRIRQLLDRGDLGADMRWQKTVSELPTPA